MYFFFFFRGRKKTKNKKKFKQYNFHLYRLFPSPIDIIILYMVITLSQLLGIP